MDETKRLSTVDIIEIARAHVNRFTFQDIVDISMVNSFFCGDCFDLSDKEIKDVELVVLLLASAEKVSKQQFDQASRILKVCDFLSSNNGSSVQRMVHYYTKALQEKIDQETGANTSNIRETKNGGLLLSDENTVCMKPALIKCYEMLPFVQVSVLAGIQAIVEHVASARKVHYIDLAIRTGGQCTALMQALAIRNEVPLELLKVTAIGTAEEAKIEETGKRLACFAESLNIPFSFKTAMVTHMKDINEGRFEMEDGEVVAIYSSSVLCHLVGQPDCFKALIRVRRNLNPCVMVVTECEAKLCSPIFMERFLEALSSSGSHFDYFEDSMDRDDQNRFAFEETYFTRGIKNIVAEEDANRTHRIMTMDDWRKYLTKFGLVEAALGSSSLYQAELVKQLASGNCCTCQRNGESMIIKWKGAPLRSLSAWKFKEQEAPRQSCNGKQKSLGK
ncbi:hypothetical protein SLA2020_038540 [Shorea laevis]